MALTATPVFIQKPRITPQNFVQGTDSPGGAGKTLFTAGVNGSKIVSCIVSNSDNTVTHLLTLNVVRSGVTYQLGSYILPVNVGGDGSTPGVDLLSVSTMAGLLPYDNDGQRYLFLESGDVLNLVFGTALTTSKAFWVNTVGADF